MDESGLRITEGSKTMAKNAGPMHVSGTYSWKKPGGRRGSQFLKALLSHAPMDWRRTLQTDPVLSLVDMIVEVHPEAGSSQMIWRRFEKTHRCERLDYIPRRGRAEESRGEQGQEWLVLTQSSS